MEIFIKIGQACYVSASRALAYMYILRYYDCMNFFYVHKIIIPKGSCLSCSEEVMKSLPYLLQRLAVAVQRGNAASVMGTFAREDCLVFEDSDAC